MAKINQKGKGAGSKAGQGAVANDEDVQGKTRFQWTEEMDKCLAYIYHDLCKKVEDHETRLTQTMMKWKTEASARNMRNQDAIAEGRMKAIPERNDKLRQKIKDRMAYGRSTFNPNVYPEDTWKDWINEDGEWSPHIVSPRNAMGIMLFENALAEEKDPSNTAKDKNSRRRVFGGRKKTARESVSSEDSEQEPLPKRKRTDSDDDFLPQAPVEEVVALFNTDAGPPRRATIGRVRPTFGVPLDVRTGGLFHTPPNAIQIRVPTTADVLPAPQAPQAAPLRTSPRRIRRNDQVREDDAVPVDSLGDLYPNDSVIVTGYGEYYQLVSVPKLLNVRFEDTQHALMIHLTRAVGSVNTLLSELTNKFQALKAHFLMPLEKDAYEQRAFRFTISIPAPQHLARPVAHRQVLRGETDAVIAVKWESAEDNNTNDFVS
jgi:hypothetical protein